MGLEWREPPATMKIIGREALWRLTLLKILLLCLGQRSFPRVRKLTMAENLEMWKDTVFLLNRNDFINSSPSATVA